MKANVEIKKLLKLLPIKLQRRLVFGHAGVGDKTIDSTLLGDDHVHGLSHTLFNCYVGLDEAEI